VIAYSDCHAGNLMDKVYIQMTVKNSNPISQLAVEAAVLAFGDKCIVDFP